LTGIIRKFIILGCFQDIVINMLLMNEFGCYKWFLGFVVFFILVGLMREQIVRFLLYPAPSIKVPSRPPEPLMNMTVLVSEKLQIQCWYCLNDTHQPWLIFFHGNGENLQTIWLAGIFDNFEKLGINYLAVEYPGYGNSIGTAQEKFLLESAQAVVEKVQTEFHPESIVLFGWSLGAAVAIQTADNHPPNLNGLILASPWLSLKAIAKEHYPDWLVNLLLTEKYDSFAIASQIALPVLVIHGSRDEIIPVQHGRRLSQQFPRLIQMLEIPQAHHGDLLAYPQVWQSIAEFILAF
jgi:pimeloyl-ACP methyl ester carboxylesterase